MKRNGKSTVFTPFKLAGIGLRNRVIRTAAFEGMSPDGIPSDALIEHHAKVAAGGVAMTTLAYCSVSKQGLTFSHQLHMRPEIHSQLRRFTEAVHREGAAASIQLGHAGYFASKKVIGCAPLAPSRCFNTYGLAFSKEMTEAQIEEVTLEFVSAAGQAVSAGFDAVEIHVGHGYLLSQFLSPHTNRRNDRFGGSLENRMRFPLSVVRRVKEAVGLNVPVLAKMNLTDGFKGGLVIEEAVEVARGLEAGGADALVLSGGFVSKTPLYMLRGNVPLKEMVSVQKNPVHRVGLMLFGKLFVQTYPFEELFFLEEALEVRRAVDLPLVLVGGVSTLLGMQTAMKHGFEFVAMGRALIADPDFVRNLQSGEKEASECDQCNICIAEMERGGVRCVLLDRHEQVKS